MLVNIISLPHRQDRRDKLSIELKRQGISEYKYWDGIIDKWHPCTGISLAHKQIIRDAKEKGLKECCIMEDDCTFSDAGAFNYFVSNIPNEYDLFLGCVYTGEIKNNIVRDFTAMILYICHERFYDKFLSTPQKNHIDREMKTLSGLYVVSNPFVCNQTEGFSDNAEKNFTLNDNKKYLYGRSFYKSEMI